MKNIKSAAILSVAACLWFTQGASGATAVTPLGGQYFVSGSVSTPLPGNNNPNSMSQSPNTLTFNENVTNIFGNWGASFGLSNSAASTEYFVTKNVTNDSGQNWGTFSIDTFSSAAFDVGVTKLPTISGNGTSNAAYQQIGSTGFLFSGLNVPNTGTITLTFSIDTCANCSGSTQIAQQASGVPEPAAMALTGCGLVSLGLCRRRRRSHSHRLSR
jgi:hypothetical protein